MASRDAGGDAGEVVETGVSALGDVGLLLLEFVSILCLLSLCSRRYSSLKNSFLHRSHATGLGFDSSPCCFSAIDSVVLGDASLLLLLLGDEDEGVLEVVAWLVEKILLLPLEA